MDLIADGDQSRVCGLGVAELIDEVEAGRRGGHERALFGVAAQESINHRVGEACLVLHGEVEAEELAHPMVLRNCGEALDDEVLEAVVVGFDEEATAPQVRSPMTHGVDEANKLSLVCRERAMARCHRAAEEGDRVAVLDEHRAKAMGRGITLDVELLGEVWHERGWEPT